MKYLVQIDYFGTKFNFNIMGRSKFKSLYGSLLSIFIFIILIVIIFIFGQDFIFKKNPRILQQIVYPDDYLPPYNISINNFVIPWRITDGDAKEIDITNTLYTKGWYYEYINNSTGNVLIEERFPKITKCSLELSKVIEFNNNRNLSNWNCWDWKEYNYSIGGSWDDYYINYFYLDMYFCKDGIEFSSKNNCTTLDKVLKLFGKNIYFEVLYPEFYLVPEDINNPLRITYKSYYFKIDINNFKIDRIYFSEAIINDDIGIIFENIKQHKVIGGVEVKSEISFYDIKNYGLEGTSSNFYSLMFYSKKNYYKWNRSYMKIQELIAVIGGFMKVIIFFGELIGNFLNYKLSEIELISNFFEYKEDNIGSSNIKNELKDIKFKNQSQIELVDRNIHCFINRLNLKNEQITNNKNNEVIIKKDFRILLKTKEYSSKLYFTLRKSIKNTIFFFCKKSNKDLLLCNIKNFLNKKLDVLYYLNHLNTNDIIHKLLFNQFQILAVNNIKNPNLADLKNISLDIEEKKTDIIFEELKNYFVSKINDNSLDEYDTKLIEILNLDI